MSGVVKLLFGKRPIDFLTGAKVLVEFLNARNSGRFCCTGFPGVVFTIDADSEAGLNMIMYLAGFEQIFYFFVKSLLFLLKEHLILLIAIMAATPAAYGVFLIRKRLRAKAKPSVTDAQVRIDPCDLSTFRFFTGSFVAVNDGQRRCNLTRVQLLHESLNFQISDITDQRKRDLTAQEKGRIGVQLPLSISGNENKKILFIGSHELGTLNELPESLSLEVTFDCRRKALLYGMVRRFNTRIYKLQPPGPDSPSK